MRLSQLTYSKKWICTKAAQHGDNKKLILFFADRLVLENEKTVYNSLRELYPNDDIISISTSGQLNDTEIYDSESVAIVIEFEKSTYKIYSEEHTKSISSREIGKQLANQLKSEHLKHALIFSEGTNINGSDLTKGISHLFNHKMSVTGGIAGDGVRFEKTLVGLNDQLSQNLVVAIGLYGDQLNVGFGEKGGFETFGPIKTITKSHRNELYEIDNQNAIELYKKYLGNHAENLAESSLYFPLSVRIDEKKDCFVRTILSIDEAEKKMTFAGDIPEGANLRLMRTNIDNLLVSAGEAAEKAKLPNEEQKDELVLIVSCVGRKVILEHRVEEEIEEVKEAINNPNACITGFYSYGEISSTSNFKGCDLYNQTMTITTIYED